MKSETFRVVAQDEGTRARAGVLRTAHGEVETPTFMPVGTGGTVKAIAQDELEELGVQILLANTYHLYLRPGHEVVQRAGGLHGFMGWPHPILTDSGGFQVMSLEGLRRITDDGVEFQSHLDGSSHFFSPERVIEFEVALGADVIVPLDECVEFPAGHERVRRAVELTGRWAARSWEKFRECREEGLADGQALFGIVQGGIHPELRQQSAEGLLRLDFPGYAIGGLSVGEPKAQTYELVETTTDLLPQAKPRYLMGVGTPEDLVEAVARGVDLMDCVLPTRNARSGYAFTSAGKVVIKNARYREDSEPLDAACGCRVCKRYSRGYLRHLVQSQEMLGSMLLTHHNLYFYLDTMREIRQALLRETFSTFYQQFARVRKQS